MSDRRNFLKSMTAACGLFIAAPMSGLGLSGKELVLPKAGTINIKDLIIAPSSLRSVEIHSDLVELAKSIEKMGITNPLVITPKAELACGFMRVHAMKMIGMEEAPYVLYEE